MESCSGNVIKCSEASFDAHCNLLSSKSYNAFMKVFKISRRTTRSILSDLRCCGHAWLSFWELHAKVTKQPDRLPADQDRDEGKDQDWSARPGRYNRKMESFGSGRLKFPLHFAGETGTIATRDIYKHSEI